MSLPALAVLILLLLITASGIYSLFSLFCIIEFFVSEEQEEEKHLLPPVSILKPLKGSDPELRENIRSFCKQDYPEFEVLLGFTDPSDSALAAAEELAVAQTDCTMSTVLSTKGLGANQKVSNLHGLVKAARYPLVAISDSDMRVDPDYLRKIAGEYHRSAHVGLVTSLYKISDPVSVGAALESLTIALDFIPSVLVAKKLEGVTFGLGASMLLSKGALEDIGGLPAIADYLADDYQIGNRLWKKGYEVILSRHVIEDVAGAMSMPEYIIHQVRWARTYRACRPKGYLGYGITHILVFSLLLLLLQGPTVLSLSLLCVVLSLRYSLAFVLYKKVIRSKKWLKWLMLLPIKDIAGFGIWLWSMGGQKVLWRGKFYKVARGGKITP